MDGRGAEDRAGAPPGLIETLRAINRQRHLDGPDRPQEAAALGVGVDSAVRREIEAARNRLAVYGTLAPGETNHHLVEPLGGAWRRGEVRGSLYPHGWGASLGFPAMIWDPDAPAIEVHLLESPALTTAWPELDRFEGDAYLRILVPVELRPRRDAKPPESTEIRVANLYASRSPREE